MYESECLDMGGLFINPSRYDPVGPPWPPMAPMAGPSFPYLDNTWTGDLYNSWVPGEKHPPLSMRKND